MSIVEDALPGILGPALTAGASALVLGGLWKRSTGSSGGGASGRARAGVALGIGIGYLVGHRLIAGSWPPLPGGDATLSAQQWRFYAAGLGGLVGAALALRKLPKGLGYAAGALWAALVLRAALDARFRHTWSASEGWPRIAGLALGIAAVRAFVDRRAERGGAFAAFEMWSMATGTAICFQLAHNSSNAQLAGGLAATLGAVGVLAAWASRGSLARGASAVALPLLGAMWVEGVVYGDVPVVAVAVLSAAPWLRSGVTKFVSGRPSGLRAVGLEAAAVVLVVAVGVACAVHWTPERIPYMPG